MSSAKVNLFLFVGNRNRRTCLHELDSVFHPVSLADEIDIQLFWESDEAKSYFKKNNSFERENNCNTFEIKINNQSLHLVLEIYFDSELKRVLEFTGEIENKTKELLTENNLAIRSLRLFFDSLLELDSASKIPHSVKITILKRIPVQAGLGGGSSNASTVLRILLNEYPEKSLPTTFIPNIARVLGDDVFPCYFNTPVRYYGGQIVKLSSIIGSDFSLNGMPVIVFKPPNGVNTGDAFRLLAREDKEHNEFPDELNNRGNKALSLVRQLYSENYKILQFNKILFDGLVNDFQAVVEAQLPVIREAREVLADQEGNLFSLLTGSGSALIGYFIDESLCRKAANTLRSKFEESCFISCEKLIY